MELMQSDPAAYRAVWEQYYVPFVREEFRRIGIPAAAADRACTFDGWWVARGLPTTVGQTDPSIKAYLQDCLNRAYLFGVPA